MNLNHLFTFTLVLLVATPGLGLAPTPVACGSTLTMEEADPEGTQVSFAPTSQHRGYKCSPSSGTLFPVGLNTVVCTPANHGPWCIFTIAVEDTTPPEITCPADVTIEATIVGPLPWITYPPVTATDSVDPNPTVACTPSPSGSVYTVGSTTTMTCRAKDAAGNESQMCSFTIAVVDTTPPSLAFKCPIDMRLEATSSEPLLRVGYPDIIADDAVDPHPTVTCTPMSGTPFMVGSTTIMQCLAEDASGNVSPSCSFRVAVEDTTAPEITCPADMTAAATSSEPLSVTYPSATADDAVDPNPTVTCSPMSGSLFPVGVASTVECIAEDTTGNVSEPCSFTVTVEDTTPPVIACPDDVTIEATISGPLPGVTYPPVTATDAVDPTPTVTCLPSPSGSEYTVGSTTTMTCLAEDASGNVSPFCSFTIEVVDTTAPEITCPADMTVAATSTLPVSVPYPSATASDAVDPNPTVTCNPMSGSHFTVGATTAVQCSAEDATGNVSEPCSFTVTVHDTVAPVITCSANVIAIADGDSAVVEYSNVVVHSNGPVIPVCNPLSGSTFEIGTTTVTCTATDQAGNEGSCMFSVTVESVLLRLEALHDDCLAMMDSHRRLRGGRRKRGPCRKVRDALVKYVKGETERAAHDLKDFQKKLLREVDNDNIDPEEADAMSEVAGGIIRDIGV